MRGGRWKRPSGMGPARRGLEARLRSVSPTAVCRGRSGVCRERMSWSRAQVVPPWHPAPHYLHNLLVGGHERCQHSSHGPLPHILPIARGYQDLWPQTEGISAQRPLADVGMYSWM